MIALWIVGEPGIGKSTLVRGLLGALPELSGDMSKARGRDLYAIGRYLADDPYAGPDRLAPNAIYPVIEGISQDIAGVLLIDGDKLSTARARETLVWATQYCALISDPVAAERQRKARGSNQNATWIKGRRTKARNFFDTFPDECRYRGTGYEISQCVNALLQAARV